MCYNGYSGIIFVLDGVVKPPVLPDTVFGGDIEHLSLGILSKSYHSVLKENSIKIRGWKSLIMIFHSIKLFILVV